MDTLEPLDTLTSDCIEFISSLGSNSKTLSEILQKKDSIVYNAIENGIKKANEKSTSNASKVQKFIILPRDFSLANGELGPTLKLRRPIVTKMYLPQIESLYQEASKE
jgi:long-chain-fatty-acid--CoA ligase ACSBG